MLGIEEGRQQGGGGSCRLNQRSYRQVYLNKNNG